MNVEFTSAHMETLCELKALAEKHGCRITFGVDSWTGVDPDFEWFAGYTNKIHEELNNKGDFSNGIIDTTKLWFQLYDPNNKEKQYHYLEYLEGSEAITYEQSSFEELSEEAVDFIEENRAEWDYDNALGDEAVLWSSVQETTVKGFDGLEHPNVYREGMALKFFGDLVCDYLKEERIIRNY